MEFLETSHGTPQYTNKNLRIATNNIMKYGQTIRRNWYAIAYTVAEVDRMECYKDDGFDSVHAWTEQAFGLKKSASYTLLTIGRDYTRKTVDEKGKNARYGSNLIMEGSDDFSKTQVEKMLPGGRDLAVELITAGEITTDMTAREIAKIIKAHKDPDDTQETTEDADDVQETEKEPETKLISVWDVEGHEYKVPVDILSNYQA